MHYISELMVQAIGWIMLVMLTYPAASAGLTILFLVGAIAFFNRRYSRQQRRKFRIQRGKKMTRGERQQYIRNVVGDEITDLLEQMEYDGRLSRPEVRTLYRRLAQVLTIKGLLPQKAEPKRTVEHLRNAKKLLFPAKPVNIPGPKPGENVVPLFKPAGKKKFGAKYLASKKSAHG